MLYLTVPSLALIAFNPPRKQPADHTIELFRIYWSDPGVVSSSTSNSVGINSMMR
jgi:hypothetical protein